MDFVLAASLLPFLFIEWTAADATGSMEQTSDPVTTAWIALVAVIVSTLVIIACGILARKILRRHQKSETREDELETSVMLTSIREVPDISASKADITNQLRKGLQKKYIHMYEEAKRTPFSRDGNFYSEKVFVDGGLKYIGAKQENGNNAELGNLTSYQDIFNIDRDHSSMIILEGEPGYGKSTLALQLAHDWSTSTTGSYLEDIEILILLQLRQCNNVGSIYRAIKKFALPGHAGLTDNDIKSVLQHNKSVLFIFDGFDEYPEKEKDSDIFKIITRKMFKDCKIVLTTTSSLLPETYPLTAKRVMLTGFDDKARSKYLRKALIGDDSTSALMPLEYLKKNPILHDICQVPFFFVQFAHMPQDRDNFHEQHSVTTFFHLMMSIFQSKQDEANEGNISNGGLLIKNNQSNIGKIAFEALNGKFQKLIWIKNDLQKELGDEAYQYYVDCRILIEDKDIDHDSTSDGKRTEQEVRFCHKILQEWYAALFLTDHLRQNLSINLAELLKNLDPIKNQYVYRFACGLSSSSTSKIIKYLKKIEGDENFVILCMLEQYQNVENMKDAVRELCEEGINISGHDNLLQLRMATYVLDTAKAKKIPVRGVHLQNSMKSVDLKNKAIIILSGMAITSDTLLKNLSITLTNRNFEEQEAENILEFASQCRSLRVLVFGSCVPPYTFKISSLHSNMKLRNVKVGWRLFGDDPFYVLNYSSGRWQLEDGGGELSKDDYERMRLKRQDAAEMWTEECNINMAKADRRYLRELTRRKEKEMDVLSSKTILTSHSQTWKP